MDKDEIIIKNNEIINYIEKWFTNYANEKTIYNYLKKMNYQRVLVFGKGVMARMLITELSKEPIEIVDVFDSNDNCDADYFNRNNADVIIVTSPYFFYEVFVELQKKTNINIVGIDDIIQKLKFI